MILLHRPFAWGSVVVVVAAGLAGCASLVEAWVLPAQTTTTTTTRPTLTSFQASVPGSPRSTIITTTTTTTAPFRRGSVSSWTLRATDDKDANDNDKNNNNNNNRDEEVTEADVVIIGAGLGGLCAGAVLNAIYGKQVVIVESHYLAGGCAHAFERKAPNGQAFTMDSGPTILLGCTQPPYNALQQILQAVREPVDWIPYPGWGMIERPATPKQLEWTVQLGPNHFQQGPLQEYAHNATRALQEYRELQALTQPLLAGVDIPALALRPGPSKLIPLLLRHASTLWKILSQGDRTTGTFAAYMDGPLYKVTDPWLRAWLDALAFSLSGLPAARTAAAAVAFTISDMHKPGACLDYPRGGMGSIVDALVRAVEKAPLDSSSSQTQSRVWLRQHVQQIEFNKDGSKATGVRLTKGGRVIRAREGVICNAPVWSLRSLVDHHPAALARLLGNPKEDPESQTTTTTTTTPSSWLVDSPETNERPRVRYTRAASADAQKATLTDRPLDLCDTAEQTASFLHLHLAINATGLDTTRMHAHYTVMDRGLTGDDEPEDGPCGELNMIAVSNPCILDPTLAPPGTMVLHAYGAGNEPYELWQGLDRNSEEYRRLKEDRCRVLWRAVESVVPDVRDRVLLDLTGSPLTHERFLRRPRGTYGSATEDYLEDGATPIDNLVLAGDGIFPGIGVPAVALTGASAANAFVSPWEQWKCLQELDQKMNADEAGGQEHHDK